MKRFMKIMSGIGAATILCVLASTPSFAGASYSFGFNYGGGGHYRPYGYRPCYTGAYYSYCPPPVVYYYPPPAGYPYYTYGPPAPPVYYYSGGVYYRH